MTQRIRRNAMRKRPNIKIIIEKHKDGYIAYPLGLKGVVVGQGDTYNQVLDNVRSAIRVHGETFGPITTNVEEAVLEAFVAETEVC
jgi:predicted RNase H-like HicB family nuclease